MFGRVLIANRGEIVIRIARTLRRLGCSPAAVYAHDDGGEFHLRCCDVAVAISSYLDVDEIVAAARGAGADAVHPATDSCPSAPSWRERVRRPGLRGSGRRPR